MLDLATLYLDKAFESLAGAESEFVNGRFNNCANRCYYACFQAAITALMRAGVTPPGGLQADWGHGFVQAEFVRALIQRRKLYAATVRDALPRTYILRETADYDHKPVSRIEVARALRRARELVAAIEAKGDAVR